MALLCYRDGCHERSFVVVIIVGGEHFGVAVATGGDDFADVFAGVFDEFAA